MTLQHSFPLLWRTLKLYIDIKDLWVEPGNEQKQNFIVLCLEDFRVNILLQCNLACWLIKICCCCCCWKKNKNGQKILNIFPKNTYRWWPTDMKRCSTSVIREMQIQIWRDITSHMLEWLSLKRPQINVGKYMEEREP